METLQIDLKKLSRPNWTSEEYAKVETVLDFVQNLMNNHNFDYIQEHYGANPYKQHNQSMKDGIEGVLEVVSAFAKRYPAYTYDVKHIYVDGDFVHFHSHVTNNLKHRGNPKKGLNIMDVWKVENGIITEHWDAVQAIHGSMRFLFWLIGGKFNNSNSYF